MSLIKAKGGLTFAQDPATAKQGGMPQSAIKANVVDFILSPERIAQELMQLSGYASQSVTSEEAKSKSQEADALQAVFQLVRNQTLVDFSDYKPSTVLRRVQRQIRIHKQDNIVDYAA